jgi:hypothetical protein
LLLALHADKRDFGMLRDFVTGRAGDSRVVRRIGRAYGLHPGADVYLWRLDVQASGAKPADLTAMREAFRSGVQKRLPLGPWLSRFETLLARKLVAEAHAADGNANIAAVYNDRDTEREQNS